MDDNIILTLKFDHVKSIFGTEEGSLMSGGRVYFSKRLMLSTIYNQLSTQQKETLTQDFPMVMDALTLSRMA